MHFAPDNYPAAPRSEPGRFVCASDSSGQNESSAMKERLRDKMLDKTLADSFPTSDPPSSLPDPSEEDTFPE
jgi:hypothetical protein